MSEQFLPIAPSSTSQYLARAIVQAYAECLGLVDVEPIARIIDREMDELEAAEHRSALAAMADYDDNGPDYNQKCAHCDTLLFWGHDETECGRRVAESIAGAV